eukprot:363564-Chlamydomonas_euryale.AAC.14
MPAMDELAVAVQIFMALQHGQRHECSCSSCNIPPPLKAFSTIVDAVEFDQLGVARKATVHQTTTTLVADAASRDEIELRVKQLKKVCMLQVHSLRSVAGWAAWQQAVVAFHATGLLKVPAPFAVGQVHKSCVDSDATDYPPGIV